MIQRLGSQVDTLATLFAKSTVSGSLDSVAYEKFFRNYVDLGHIDDIVSNNLKNNMKTNIAFIGLGKSGIEPLTYLTQIFLSARRLGKKLDDTLGKVDFIDIQKGTEIKHSKEILDELEKSGSDKFKYFYSGLAPKEKEEIYNKFLLLLKESDSRYLGHYLEDFVDNPINHNKYDMTFCNNVFYYVGKGKSQQYKYVVPGNIPAIFESPGCYDRYFEVMTNLLSTLKKDGKVFFHHDVGKEQNNQITKNMKKLVSQLDNYKETDLNIIKKIN